MLKLKPDLSDDLEGPGKKIIIPSSITNIKNRLEVSVGLKISVHTDTLTKAPNSIDELYKRDEIQNEQEYRNAFDKFHTKYKELPSKLLERIAFNTRPKTGEHMLIVLKKTTHGEHSFEPHCKLILNKSKELLLC